MATDYSIACLARGGDAAFLAAALMDARRPYPPDFAKRTFKG